MKELNNYSIPKEIEKTKLATIYSLNYRDSKKGRLFMPLYDERFPLDFEAKYIYCSKFLEKDNTSGNHYHKIKQEILVPMEGNFEISLEDIITKNKEVIVLDSSENKAIYIRTGISHKIRSTENSGVLLVLASVESSLEDEIEYKVD